MNARGHLSSETIDLLMLASLAASEAEQAKAHLSGCAVCKTRWNELEEDKARFEQFVLPRTLSGIEARASPSLSNWLRGSLPWLAPAMGLALASLVAVVVVPKLGAGEEDAYIGLKGIPQASMEVVASRAGQQFSVKEGTRLRAHDKIRFVVNPGSARFLLIASRDGKGEVTIYYPYQGSQSAPIAPGRQELPDSVELDEVAGREWLVAIFSDAPVPASQVRAALEHGGEGVPEIETGGAKTQLSWEFVKEAP